MKITTIIIALLTAITLADEKIKIGHLEFEKYDIIRIRVVQREDYLFNYEIYKVMNYNVLLEEVTDEMVTEHMRYLKKLFVLIVDDNNQINYINPEHIYNIVEKQDIYDQYRKNYTLRLYQYKIQFHQYFPLEIHYKLKDKIVRHEDRYWVTERERDEWEKNFRYF